MRCSMCNRRLTDEELLPLNAKQLTSASCYNCLLVVAIATHSDEQAMTQDQYYIRQNSLARR